MSRIVLVMLLAVLIPACGSSAAPPLTTGRGSPTGADGASATLGSAGGTFTFGALTVTVPAGALKQDTVVSATPITSTAPAARGEALRLGPEGLTFAQPVTITFSYTDADLVGTAASELLVAWQRADGTWASRDNVVLDEVAHTVSIQTLHFSDWTKVGGVLLRPGTAKVPTNGTLNLKVRQCYAPDDESDGLGKLVVAAYDCDAAQSPEIVYHAGGKNLPFNDLGWAVNGTRGGSAKVGRVVGNGTTGEATFTAPGTPPQPSKVAVSAEVVYTSAKKLHRFTVVSNVTITGGAHLEVTGEYTNLADPISPTHNATVQDPGVRFTLSWPLPTYGNIDFTNLGPGAARVSDTRAECVQPEYLGNYDYLKVTSMLVSGGTLFLNGDTIIPDLRTGSDEGCQVAVVNHGSSTSRSVLVMLPAQLTGPTASFPQATIDFVENNWRWVYRPVQD